MNVLVVGGAGYVGSHVVAQLLRRGDKVTVLDNLSKGHAEAVGAAELVVGDVADENVLGPVLAKGIDAVMHFAAFSLVGESVDQPIKYYENNVGGTIALVKAMVSHGVKSLVFSSTAATYGEPKELPIPETHPTCPTNPYGETKLAVEKALRWMDEAYGIASVCLRYFNAAGADESGKIGEDHTPETHLIPVVLQAALGKRPSLTLYGTDYPTPDGTCVRDYIHVTDLADAHLLSVDYILKGGKSDHFNLGNGVGFSNRQIVDVAKQVTGLDIPVVEGARRSGDPAVLVASSAKARKILGWSPSRPDMETIIGTAWEFQRKHPAGYGDRT